MWGNGGLPCTGDLRALRRETTCEDKRRSLAGGNGVLRRPGSLVWPFKAPQRSTAFRFFHFSIWGLRHWSVSVEGALRPGLWEPFRAFTADLLRFGQSKGEVRDISTEREEQKQR